MNQLKLAFIVLIVAMLSACGGGGGSAGTTLGGTAGTGGTSGTVGTTTTTISTPTLVLSIVDGSGNLVSSNSISGGLKRVKAVLKDSAGVPVPLKLVTFSVPSVFANLNPSSGSVLTDVNGVAQIVIQPADFGISGASSVSANTNLSGTPLAASLDIQASSANVTFGSIAANTSLLTAYQSTAVEVPVFVDGLSATAGQVNVNFSSSCGSFTPASILSGSNGKAQTTFTATGCLGGSVSLSVSASGVSVFASTLVNVIAPSATNLQYVSATPQTIYSQQALFGDKQAVVTFRLVDSAGNGIDGQTIDLNLSGSAIASGVIFADTNATTATQATSGGGYISLNVRSGDVPTPVTINGSLRSNPAISASSGGLVVNSGAPVQNFFSISASSFNIEGLGYDGELSTINIRAADRLAQPVPNGTVISFIAEGGQVSASCATSLDGNGKSGCSTSISSQAFRPANGRVTVLAYAEGLEPFVDNDGDNKWNTGEIYGDVGQPFLDANENGAYDIGEQKVGSGASAGIGTQACATPSSVFGFIPSSVPNTCSNSHGKALIRAQAVIAFSGSFAQTPTTLSLSRTLWTFRLADANNNAMPKDSVIEATVTGGSNCSIDRIVPSSVPSTPNPTIHSVLLKTTAGAAGTFPTCEGATLTVSVKTPKGNETLFPLVVMP